MRSKTVDRLMKNTPKDIEIFVDLYADIVVRINQILKEKGISKKELAERLDKRPSEISKWLNVEHNFTLRSLAKLSAELDEPILQVPQRKVKQDFIPGFSRSVSTFVVYRKIEEQIVVSKQAVKPWQKAQSLNPLSNVG